MTQHLSVLAELQSMLQIVLFLLLPPLLGAVVVGLLVGTFQAVAQIQDQSLPMGAKLVAIAAILLLAGPLMIAPLVNQSTLLFDRFPALTR